LVTPFGRAVKNGSSGIYEYNLTDHLGNVRAVIRKGSNNLAELIQQKHYYPFGMEMSNISLGTGTNKYLYNGKELENDYGIYLYDYGARFYDPQLARFHTLDPLAEKNNSQSNYIYAVNNPIKYIDFMGLDTLLVNRSGRFSDTRLPDPNNKNDVLVLVNNKERNRSEIKYNKKGELKDRHKFKEIEKNSLFVRPNKDENGNIVSSIISPNNIDVGLEVFKWLSDNTNVEYSYIRDEGLPIPTITTNHKMYEESLGATEAVRMVMRGQYIIHIHNHPNGVEASDEDRAFYEKIGKFGKVLGIYSNNKYKSYQNK
jgi:RHS repeat-associated protein